MTRVLTGATLAALAVLAILFAPPWLFFGALVLLTAGASFELAGLLEGTAARPFRILAVAGPPALVAAAVVPAVDPLVVAAGFAALATGRALLAGTGIAEAVPRLAATLFAFVYLGVTFAHISLLFGAEAAGPVARDGAGRALLLFTIAATYAGDTAAFYGGRSFGRTPLAPRVSPKKTREGALFGLAGSALAGAIAGLLLVPGIGPAAGAALGAGAGGAGIAGDLFESSIKRAGRAKDSGRLLPGHGGILDRLDSLTFAAPLVFWANRLLLAAA